MKDPRLAKGIRHHKISILMITICAVLSGAKSFIAIAESAQRYSQNMLRRLRCRFHKKTNRYKPPSEPTIRRFLKKVNAGEIDTALSQWFFSLSNADHPIAVDGKTLKGARLENGRKVQLLSAFFHEIGMVIGQHPVADKTNEIPTLPQLLAPLPIEGRVVTIDALHTQVETARYLVEEKKADYLMTVKDNQPTLKADIATLRMEGFPPSGAND